MAYTTIEARQELLEGIVEAAEELAFAIASLGAAYEQLDDPTADRLEEELFQPVQAAYGRAKRTHAEFAGRHGLAAGTFEPQSAGVPSTGTQGFIENAVEGIGAADRALATLQDSGPLLEVGDVELRAGLSEVRELIGPLPHRSRELVRTLGR